MKHALAAATLLLCLTGCSPEAADPPDVAPDVGAERPPPAEPLGQPPADAPSADNVLALDGLHSLRIGEAVPVGSSWSERGAQISDDCRTVSSPEFPGVYAIVEDGKVRRVTVGQRSDIKLAEGIGVGSPEAEVRAAFPGFRQAPHAYVGPPAKYLTAPSADNGDPALRFEIGDDAKVSLIHVGTMPVLGYVEGCA